MPGQVIGYVRVSTVDQNPERQVIAIKTAVGTEPERWFTDQASGGSTDRPALAAMLTHVRCEDVMVVASMDRLARSLVDFDQLVSHLTTRLVTIRFLMEGLSFQAAGQADPLAVFQLQVMGAFAQLERALIRDRQREGTEAATARGVYLGRARRLTTDEVAAARQRVLGHSSATTMRTYAHLWPRAQDQTRKAAAGLMREAMGVPADSLRTVGT